jgi:ribosomal protein L31E
MDDNSTFKKRAPRAMKEIKKFAQKAMGTKVIFCPFN